MPPDGSRLHRLAGCLLGLAGVLSACGPKITAPPEPPPSVRRGDDAFRYKQYGVAIDAYRDYIDQSEPGAYTARVIYKTALAHYRLMEYRQTLVTLDEISQRYPQRQWVQVEALRGDSERALGNNMAALQDWEKAWTIASDTDRQKLRKRITTTAQDLSDVDLASARRLAIDDGFAALLDRQIVARQPADLGEPVPNAEEGEGGLEAAETVAARPTTVIDQPREPLAPVADEGGAPQGEGTVPAAVAVAAPPDDLAWAPPPPTAAPAPRVPIAKAVAPGAAQIGCLLPLSGAASELGERALRAIRLVFTEHDTRLVVADTESDPAVAARQFEEVASGPNVLAVIGPLSSTDAESVARRAEELRVPALLLSSQGSLNSQFSLQFGVTRAEQVKALLDYAMGRIQLHRFGVLYPEDAKDSVAIFRSAVQRRGGSVVGAFAYPVGSASLTSAAATIRQWHDRDNLQALFLQDDAAVAGEFATFLQREMPDVTLLGVDDWGALAQQERGLSGVLFVDGFYAGSERLPTRTFIERFQHTYNDVPGLVEADAYDAAMLADRALSQTPRSSADLLSVLRALGPVQGAGGEATVTAVGVSRNVFLVQVSAGRLLEIGESSPTLARGAPLRGVALGAAPAPAPVQSTKRGVGVRSR